MIIHWYSYIIEAVLLDGFNTIVTKNHIGKGDITKGDFVYNIYNTQMGLMRCSRMQTSLCFFTLATPHPTAFAATYFSRRSFLCDFI